MFSADGLKVKEVRSGSDGILSLELPASRKTQQIAVTIPD